MPLELEEGLGAKILLRSSPHSSSQGEKSCLLLSLAVDLSESLCMEYLSPSTPLHKNAGFLFARCAFLMMPRARNTLAIS